MNDLKLTKEERDLLADALRDYQEGVEQSCEDDDLLSEIEILICSIERKLNL